MYKWMQLRGKIIPLELCGVSATDICRTLNKVESEEKKNTGEQFEGNFAELREMATEILAINWHMERNNFMYNQFATIIAMKIATD